MTQRKGLEMGDENRIEFDAKALKRVAIDSMQKGVAAVNHFITFTSAAILLPEDVDPGNYHVMLTPIEPESIPKPCPFCGSEADCVGEGREWWVMCSQCGGKIYNNWWSRADAIAAWNKRVK